MTGCARARECRLTVFNTRATVKVLNTPGRGRAMPDTAEHRADMHQLARERVKAGKPVWAHKVNLADVFHNDTLTFEQRRDAIVRRIRATAWFKDYDESSDLPMFVEELADAEDSAAFDDPWDCIYDIADADRVWIATF